MAQVRETVRAAFAFYDADSSGTIDAAELRSLVADLGGYLTDKELATALSSLDRDGNGTIDEDEFLTWWTAQSDDLDGDGQVGELERALERVKASGQDRFRVDIHAAAWRGAVDVVQRLLQDDADLAHETDTSEYSGGNTPLHYAAYQGHTSICDILISAGAKVNAVNTAGCTPLFLAAQQSRGTTVSLLLERGADIRIAEKHHQFTAVDVCTSDEILTSFRARVGGVPAVPDPPHMLASLETSISIEWTTPKAKHDQIIPISGYKIRAVDSSGTSRAVLVGALPTQYTVENLQSDSVYTLQLAAINLHGISAFSSSSEPMKTRLARPAPPTQLRTRSLNATSIEITWTGDSDQYIVQQCVDVSADLWKVIGKVDEPRLVVSNLLEAHKYRYRVAAVSATAGQSDFSYPVEARTRYANGDDAKSTPRGLDGISGRKARDAACAIVGAVQSFRSNAKELTALPQYPLPENAVMQPSRVKEATTRPSRSAATAKSQQEESDMTVKHPRQKDTETRHLHNHGVSKISLRDSDSDDNDYVYFSDTSDEDENLKLIILRRAKVIVRTINHLEYS